MILVLCMGPYGPKRAKADDKRNYGFVSNENENQSTLDLDKFDLSKYVTKMKTTEE